MACLFIGILFIVLGLLVYLFPNLIAGYNTLSKKDKAKVNIKRYKLFLSILIASEGLFLILIYFIFSSIGKLSVVGNVIFPISIIVMVIIAAILASSKKMKNLDA